MRTLLLILLVGSALLKVAMTEVEMQEGEQKVVEEEEEEVVITSGREEEGEVPVVMTSTGKISGIREHSTEGKAFFSYYSIPFAKPPVGSLRFKVSDVLTTSS